MNAVQKTMLEKQFYKLLYFSDFNYFELYEQFQKF